jgi:hypothetical protein
MIAMTKEGLIALSIVIIALSLATFASGTSAAKIARCAVAIEAQHDFSWRQPGVVRTSIVGRRLDTRLVTLTREECPLCLQ